MINLEQLQKAVEYWKTVPEMEDSVLLDTARLVIGGKLVDKDERCEKHSQAIKGAIVKIQELEPLSRTELIGIIEKNGIKCMADYNSPHPYYCYPESLADAILKGRV